MVFHSQHRVCVCFCSEVDQEVLVQHYFVLDGVEDHCAAPFSWLVTFHLESLWEESEFIPGLSCQRNNPQQVLSHS